jgi:hypothetical protein
MRIAPRNHLFPKIEWLAALTFPTLNANRSCPIKEIITTGMETV